MGFDCPKEFAEKKRENNSNKTAILCSENLGFTRYN